MYSLQEKLRIDGVNKAACSPDGKWAAFFSPERGLYLLNFTTLESNVINTAFSTPISDIQQLFFASSETLIVTVGCHPNSKRYFLPLVAGRIQHDATTDDYWNNLLASAVAARVNTETTKLIILYTDYCLLKNMNTQEESRWQLPPLGLDAAGKPQYCWSQEAKLLAIATQEGITIFNSLTGERIKAISTATNATANGLCPIIFSPDGKYILSSNSLNNSLCMWEIMTGKCQYTLTIASALNVSLTLLSNGTQVLCSTAGKYFCWDLASEPRLSVTGIPGISGEIVAAYYAMNDFIVLERGTLRVLSLQGSTNLARARAATEISDAGYGASIDRSASQILGGRTSSDPGQAHLRTSKQPIGRSLSAAALPVAQGSLDSLAHTPPHQVLHVRPASPPSAFVPPAALSLLGVFIQEVYSGIYGTNADDILALIKQRFSAELAMEPSLPEHWQLQFLYICVSEIYLQQDCRRHDCGRFNLPRRHNSIDHLKRIFFHWATVKYTQHGLPDLMAEPDDFLRIHRLASFLFCNKKEDAIDNNIVLESMLATLGDFTTSASHYGVDSDSRMHKLKSGFHPYVRLGGILRCPYFIWNCRYFDMRGVDLHGSRGYDLDYFKTMSQMYGCTDAELLKHHVDFRSTDLRYANLSCTRFFFETVFAEAKLDFANLQHSNIPALLRGSATVLICPPLAEEDIRDNLARDSKNFLVKAFPCSLM